MSLYHAALFRRKRSGLGWKSLRDGGRSGASAGKLNQGTNVLKHGLLVFIGERILPAWHGSAGFALGDGPKQFLVRLGGGGCGDEIPRAWRQKRGLRSIAFACRAMAVHTMFTINGLASLKSFRRGLCEQDAGTAADQQDKEREVVGESAKKPQGRMDLCAGRACKGISCRRLIHSRDGLRTHHVRSHRRGCL